MIKLRFILLFKKGLMKHRGSFLGIFILFFVISLSLVTALHISMNSSQYISSEMDRLGYGDMTVWVQQNNELNRISEDLKDIESVDDVKIQPLIFAGYSIHNSHSDNEGQLIPYHPNDYDYQFLDEHFRYIQTQIEINNDEIYVSPAMLSTYQFQIGDQIELSIGRNSQPKKFIIKGYFEDLFMGSSMIDMKSFLINDKEFDELTNEIQGTSDFNKLATRGAMIHIFQKTDHKLSINDLSKEVNQNTALGEATEFVYSQDAIYGFMMIQQNMLSGFLGAFVVVLLIVALIVMSYNISHSLELEREDMGILKTVGFTSMDLRLSQMMQFGLSMVGGMLMGLLVAVVLAKNLSLAMVTSSGLLIPTHIPFELCLLLFVTIFLLIIAFIIVKTRQVAHIAPIQTIQTSLSQLSALQIKITKIEKKRFIWNLSKRQLLAGKKRYIGTLMISILLAFFLSLVGKINTWIGPNGEGLMDAFSVANHDLGVQPMTNINMDGIEELISSYAKIEGTYDLAMQNVLVNGVDYTANVITNPSRFHIIRGQTSQNDNEIVITEYAANDLGVDIGDYVHIIHDKQDADYKVVGIYQCANEMGANIGMNVQGYERIGQTDSYIWCRHYILSNHSMNETIMQQLQQSYPLDIAVHTNSWSGLDGIVSTMNLVMAGMYGVVGIFILIIIVLTGSKMLNFEQSDMAILKSIGLTSHQLRLSFTLRFTMVVLIGSIVGTLLSLIFADGIISKLVAIFGIGEFHSSLGFMNAILPIVMITLLFSVFAYISSHKVKKVALTQLIKGD